MAIDSFSTLQTAIGDWLNRADLTSVIPSFISLAEAEMNRSLRTRQMITRADAAIDTQFTALPGDFLQAKRLTLQTLPITVVDYVSMEQLEQERTRLAATGKPRHFSIVGNALEVVPTPDASYTGELTYYARIPALSNATVSNWVLATYPDLYLYGSLIQSAPYLRDDERITTWQALYGRAVEALNVSDERSSAGGSITIRTRVMGF